MFAQPPCSTIILSPCSGQPCEKSYLGVVCERVHGLQNSASIHCTVLGILARTWAKYRSSHDDPLRKVVVAKALNVDTDWLFLRRRKASSSLLGLLSHDEGLWLVGGGCGLSKLEELGCTVVDCCPKAVLAQPWREA